MLNTLIAVKIPRPVPTETASLQAESPKQTSQAVQTPLSKITIPITATKVFTLALRSIEGRSAFKALLTASSTLTISFSIALRTATEIADSTSAVTMS